MAYDEDAHTDLKTHLRLDTNLDNNTKSVKVGDEMTPLDISKDKVSYKGKEIVNKDHTHFEKDGNLHLESDGDVSITASGDIELSATGDLEISSQAQLTDITAPQLRIMYSLTQYSDFEMSSSGDLKIQTVGSGTTDSDIHLDADGAIVLDSANGHFISQYAGNQFSAANSAYAGMILGYTDIGLDETTATYNTTTSYTVPTSEFKVGFVIPPSGNVEIEIQVMYDVGSSNVADLYAGLSDNATYNAVDDFHEVEVFDAMSRGAIRIIRHSWTLTGLTAGDAEEIWVGFKTSNTTGTPHLQWGGDAADQFPDFIMKATALPALIYS